MGQFMFLRYILDIQSTKTPYSKTVFLHDNMSPAVQHDLYKEGRTTREEKMMRMFKGKTFFVYYIYFSEKRIFQKFHSNWNSRKLGVSSGLTYHHILGFHVQYFHIWNRFEWYFPFELGMNFMNIVSDLFYFEIVDGWRAFLSKYVGIA